MKTFYLLPLFVLSFIPFSVLAQYQPTLRTYYIAAETVEWNYAPVNKDLIKNKKLPSPWGDQTKYTKVRYIEYSDQTFTQKKPQPPWLGIMGPIIRAVEGDTIQVVFKNKSKGSYSLHPHGLFYDKNNEGACYASNNIENCAVREGETKVYTWKATKKSAPSAKEGGSKVWLYHSHVDSVKDIYKGLLGPIIVTSAKFAGDNGATPTDVDREFVSLFFIFDESTEEMSDEEKEGHLMHAMNGYIFGNQPGLVMNQGDRVRWHLIGMGTEVDIHTPHWHGELVSRSGVHTDVIELLPASMISVDMLAENPGKWLYHCHVTDHITAGMISLFEIKELKKKSSKK